MKTFTDVAGLALANLTAGQEVSTKGYYTAGDGGQATYLIVAPTAADEFGDHTLANTNVALLQETYVANVRQFGAVGDGVADDTLAIQASIDSGKPIYLPTGNYLCGELVHVESGGHFTMYGDGPSDSIITSTSVTRSLRVEGDASFQRKVIIKDLTIDGNASAQEVYIYKCLNVLVSSVVVTGHVGKNVHLLRSYQCQFYNCSFTPDGTAECSFYSATNAVEITGNCYINAEGTTRGIIVAANEVGGPDCYNIIINGNVFESCTEAISFQPNMNITSGIQILNNYFELVANTTYPIYIIGGEHQSINIENNHTGSSCAAFAVIDKVSSRSRINISGNTMYRPILVYTTVTIPATNIDIDALPYLNITDQDTLFDHATINFDNDPTVIIDEYWALSEIFTGAANVPSVSESFKNIKGRFFRNSVADTPEDLLRLFVFPSGGTTYAGGFKATFDVNWRPAPKTITGVNSFQIENHLATTVARSTGTQKVVKRIESLATEAVPLSILDVFNDTINNQANLVGTGDITLPQSEWHIYFDIQAMV